MQVVYQCTRCYSTVYSRHYTRRAGAAPGPATAINVHGHPHGKPAPTPRHVNVSVEQIDYTPVCLDQLLKTFRNQRKALSAV